MPIGTGILLLGGRDHRIENNRIYGNFLGGIAAIDSILLAEPAANTLDRNIVRNNQFGLGGTDVNGRDVAYDGSGTDNCFTLAARTRRSPPTARRSASARRARTCSARPRGTRWSAGPATGALNGWTKHAHPAKQGYKPLEDFKP